VSSFIDKVRSWCYHPTGEAGAHNYLKQKDCGFGFGQLELNVIMEQSNEDGELIDLRIRG
jgi:translation elongation factor EF-1beta